MNFKLSRNKVNFLATLITDYIRDNDDLDYNGDIGNIRLRVFHLIMDELRSFNQIEDFAKERVRSQKKTVPEGSREWEILFRKYAIEELEKMGKVW
ncbi:MAG: DUF507 family protein [Acidobacteriota bacterium]